MCCQVQRHTNDMQYPERRQHILTNRWTTGGLEPTSLQQGKTKRRNEASQPISNFKYLNGIFRIWNIRSGRNGGDLRYSSAAAAFLTNSCLE